MKMHERLDKLATRNNHVDRWLIHLFQQKKRQRLMFVLGGGASINANIPGWSELVARVASAVREKFPNDKVYQGGDPTFDSQILKNRIFTSGLANSDLKLKRLELNQDWHQTIHSALYRDTPDNIAEIMKVHPYLKSMASIALDTPYVLTFNFDDLLWESMMHVLTERKSSNSEDKSRQPNVIWRPQVSEHPNASTIFHINGRLPHSKLAKRSEEIIFTEDSFADAFVSVNTPVFEQHVYKMSNATQLIVGHSLHDASLKNLLHTLRNRVPGNVSYYLKFVSDEDGLTSSEMSDIFDTNLDVYNIITIFVDDTDVTTIMDVLNKPEDEFAADLGEFGCKNIAQKYYVVGAVGSGKTTTLENLRHFWTLEEWPSEILSVMYSRSDNEKTIEHQNDISAVVDRAVSIKNANLARQRVGYYFMDRGPFDALAFQPDAQQRAARRERLLNLLQGKLEPGEICFLAAGGEECERRNWKRGRPPSEGGDAKYFDQQEAGLLDAYGLTRDRTYASSTIPAGEVARNITLKALLGQYEPWSP